MMVARVLHSDVLEVLGAEIANGDYEEGTVLRLADLERRFGVSRTVMREAMRVLESLGMVAAKRRVGLVVQPLENWAVFDRQVIGWRLAGSGREDQLRSLTLLRASLEPIAARLAAEFGQEHGPRLVGLAGQLAALGAEGRGASHEYLQVDIEFHTLLIRCGGNEMFAAMADAVAEVLTGRNRLGLTPAFPASSSIDEHQALARAVRDGAPRHAELSARRMLDVIWAEVADKSEPRASDMDESQ